MSQTPPPGYTAPPANLPIRGDRATFSTYVDAWVTWFSTVILTQLATMILNAYNNAVDCFNNAVAGAASALAASNSASAASVSAGTALSAVNAPAYNDTSTSSNAIGLGAKTFTVTAGKLWGPGMSLTFQATPGNSMTGYVTSYAGTSLVMDIQAVTGSGTFASWAIGMASLTRGLVLLATLTPTVAAAVNALTVFNGQYDSYLIIGEAVQPAAGVTLGMYYAVAGVLDTTNSFAQPAPYSTSPTGYATACQLTSTAVATAGTGATFCLRIDNANDATGVKLLTASAAFDSAVSTMISEQRVTGYRGGAVSGVGFYCAGGGNFKAQGSIRIYGIQKA